MKRMKKKMKKEQCGFLPTTKIKHLTKILNFFNRKKTFETFFLSTPSPTQNPLSFPLDFLDGNNVFILLLTTFFCSLKMRG